jgi:hypothetical protein
VLVGEGGKFVRKVSSGVIGKVNKQVVNNFTIKAKKNCKMNKKQKWE